MEIQKKPYTKVIKLSFPPRRSNYGYRGRSGNVSRAKKPNGTYSQDGRMQVRNGIWVWVDSGRPVSPKKTYVKRNNYRRY